ncbi:hypothetical protein C4D60_Mb01t07540 [Musa balbisiana]|uniref:Uncharacterized protein n=1 Tax=Musa balbisiana TaxID=52838 RepID=A0A4S8JKT1_MUSBA|nr:hypothetical protein C4D60_Mb01t07540 [Musa balbisiana]
MEKKMARTEMEVGTDGVAVITIINPPINCLSFDGTSSKLLQGFERLGRDGRRLRLGGCQMARPSPAYHLCHSSCLSLSLRSRWVRRSTGGSDFVVRRRDRTDQSCLRESWRPATASPRSSCADPTGR